ncbi:MAG: hypothetical protein JRI97_10515, partial [Deltaproteobacteria bacterium]|nr:hypothetical protein [Deltaproteobacteria bacterium]
LEEKGALEDGVLWRLSGGWAARPPESDESAESLLERALTNCLKASGEAPRLAAN